MAKKDKSSNRPGVIVVRREDAGGGGHHGGAWKVAYADFVTAMMAFFLLMWLLNATTEEQRKGLADYFSPTSELSRNHAGAGLAFGGRTAFETAALVSDSGAVRVMEGPVPIPEDPDEDEDQNTPAKSRVYRRDGDIAPSKPTDADAQGGRTDRPDPSTGAGTAAKTEAAAKAEAAAARAEEHQRFEDAADQIRQAVRADPALAAFARQLAIDITPQGLRIQILDEEQVPMFATGSASPNDRARLMLQKIGPVLARLPEPVAIAGHTDSAPFPGPGRTNWELSSERANVARRLLEESGLAATRIRTVTGNADRDPLLPSDPLAAANRRIAIQVLNTAPAAKPGQP